MQSYVLKNLRTGTIPDSLYKLTALTIFELDHNNLTGTLSDSLKNLTNLQFFNLRSNKLPVSGWLAYTFVIMCTKNKYAYANAIQT